MKFFLIAFVVILFVTSGLASEENFEKCCTECPEGTVKYYSIDTKHDRCGECCLKPCLFYMFKLYEKGLTLANEITCESIGYSEYEKTESHGFLFLKATLDKYKKPE